MSPARKAQADLTVEDHGTIALLRPLTRRAGIWLHEHVSSEPWQWLGLAVAAEPRTVPDVVAGARADGLVVLL